MFRNDADSRIGAATIVWRLWLLAFGWARFFGWRVSTLVQEAVRPARFKALFVRGKRRRPADPA